MEIQDKKFNFNTATERIWLVLIPSGNEEDKEDELEQFFEKIA